MWKQFTVQGNTQYLDILPKILNQYNNTRHSSIKMTPTEASKKKNEGVVYFNLYGDMAISKQKPKFKIGDKVRISKYKRKTFDKVKTENVVKEITVHVISVLLVIDSKACLFTAVCSEVFDDGMTINFVFYEKA